MNKRVSFNVLTLLATFLVITIQLVALVRSQTDCPYKREGLLPFYSLPGWNVAEYDVVISTPVILNVTLTTKLRSITVKSGGSLIFGNNLMNISLNFIRVESGGSFVMGSSTCSISSKITFYGARVNKTVNDIGIDPFDNAPLGSKGIAFLSGSNVQIFGRLYQSSWTELVKTAPKGSNRLELADDVLWKVGDSIVVTSTDFGEVYNFTQISSTSSLAWARGVTFPNQNEQRVIVGLDGNRTLILDAPLSFTHFASADGKMRSEVGLLTRRIVFKGDDSSDESSFGGHFLVRKVESFKMQGVEITKFGQKGLMGRYSFHFHLLQNKPLGLNFQVNDNSVHHSYQRCYVVHDTNYVTLRNNVCFRSQGHMYFLEDGSEVGNSFIDNLGVDPIPIDRNDSLVLLSSDADVSVFWITNPNNTFSGNHAVGGRFTYWFAPPISPTGLSAGKYPGYNPRTAPLALFENNVAHSTSGNALEIDQMVMANSSNGATEVASYVVSEAIFSGFTAYKSRNYGVWTRGGFHRFQNAYFSDNRIAIDLTGGPSILHDSIIIGESDNVGETYRPAVDKEGRSRPEFFEQTNGILNILKGYENYDTNGPQFLRNVEFFNFTSNSLRFAGALSLLNGNFKLPTRNRFAKLKFTNANRYFTYPMDYSAVYENHKGVALMDTDSSVINIGTLGGWITANVSTMLFFPQCKFNSEWNSYQCPFFGESYAQLKVTNKNLNDLNTTGSDGINRPKLKNDNIKMTRMIVVDLLRNVQAECIGKILDGTNDFNMFSNVIARGFYRLSWPNNIPTPEDLTLSLDSCATNDWIVVALQYPRGTTFNVKFVKGTTTFLSMASNLSAVLNEPNKYYYYDETSEHLYLKLQNFALRTAYQVVDEFVDYLSAGVFYLTVTCPNNVCAPSQFDLPYDPKLTYKTLMREDRFVGRLRMCTQSLTSAIAPNSTPGKGIVFAFLDVKTASLDFTLQHDLNAIITSLDIGVGLEGTEEYIANPTSKIIPYSQSRFGFRLSADEWNYLLQGKLFVRLSTSENPNGYMRTQLYINNATQVTCNLPPAISTFKPCDVLSLKNSAEVITIYNEYSTFTTEWIVSAYSPQDVRSSYVNANSAPAICGSSSLSFGFRTGSATLIRKTGSSQLNVDTSIYKYFEFFIKTINNSGGSPGLGIIFYKLDGSEISRITTLASHTQHFKIDGNRVTRVRIPISELNFSTSQNVNKIVFYLSENNANYMEYMLDNMRFIGELSTPDTTERTMTVSQCKYFGTVTSACGPTDNPDSDPLRIRYL